MCPPPPQGKIGLKDLAGGRPVDYLQVWLRRWTWVDRKTTPDISIAVRAVLEPGTSRFQVRRPHHSASLPPHLWAHWLQNNQYFCHVARVFLTQVLAHKVGSREESPGDKALPYLYYSASSSLASLPVPSHTACLPHPFVCHALTSAVISG